jgi:hypothetical protein
VAAADKFLEGNVEVCPVAGLGDRSERLPPMQYGQQFGAQEPVQ